MRRVMMPRGSAEMCAAAQSAALETEHHALLTTPKRRGCWKPAEAGAVQLDDLAAREFGEEMRRQRDHAIATPPSRSARLAKATARAEVFWVEARKANDFKVLAPHLEEVVHLVRDKAALLGQARGLPPYEPPRSVPPGISTAEIQNHLQSAGTQFWGSSIRPLKFKPSGPPRP